MFTFVDIILYIVGVVYNLLCLRYERRRSVALIVMLPLIGVIMCFFDFYRTDFVAFSLLCVHIMLFLDLDSSRNFHGRKLSLLLLFEIMCVMVYFLVTCGLYMTSPTPSSVIILDIVRLSSLLSGYLVYGALVIVMLRDESKEETTSLIHPTSNRMWTFYRTNGSFLLLHIITMTSCIDLVGNIIAFCLASPVLTVQSIIIIKSISLFPTGPSGIYVLYILTLAFVLTIVGVTAIAGAIGARVNSSPTTLLIGALLVMFSTIHSIVTFQSDIRLLGMTSSIYSVAYYLYSMVHYTAESRLNCSAVQPLKEYPDEKQPPSTQTEVFGPSLDVNDAL